MRSTNALLVVVAIAALAPPPATGQGIRELPVGDVTVRLGGSCEQAIKALQSHYYLDDITAAVFDSAEWVGRKFTGRWMVLSSSDEPSAATLGTLTCANGRIVGAVRAWNPEEVKGADEAEAAVGHAVLAVLESLDSRAGDVPCTLDSVESNRSGAWAQSEASIRCGPTAVTLNVTRPRGAPNPVFVIMESIEEQP